MPHTQPSNYDPTRVAVRTDASGGQIAIRPLEFLASGDDGAIQAALRSWASAAPTGPNQDGAEIGVRRGKQLRGDWSTYMVVPGAARVDVLALVRGLRARGIAAQPNHVYFVGSVSAQAVQFSPNMFAPNMFAPNMFAPNMFAPNMFAPNMFAPNMFAPNMFAGGGTGVGGCCCPDGPVDTGDVAVPALAARPAAAPAPEPAVVKETDLGKHVDIHVIDIATPSSRRDPDHSTGELEDAHHIQHAAIDENQDGWADPAMGHGDFVRSVVELGCCLHATLWEAADPLGDIDDAALVQALQEVAAKSDPSKSRILNLSLSGYNEDDRPGEILAHQIAEMIADGWVIVAAAGNNASCRLAWPAALPGVVAVGAISRCAPAWFSNYGSWVDVSAPGVDVLARFPVPKGDATLEAAIVADVDDPTNPTGKVITVADFDTGWATWSGTSFAAPYVTARIARQLEANTSPPKDPADHRARARAAIDAIVNDPTYDHVPYYGRLLG